jgi:hypothetical protein
MRSQRLRGLVPLVLGVGNTTNRPGLVPDKNCRQQRERNIVQLAKVQLARSIWLFDVQELNPHGVNVLPTLSTEFAERYRFKNLPTPEEMAKNTYKWSGGTFTLEGQLFEIAVEFHNDGIVADSRHSTDLCDLFIYDMLNWIASEMQVANRPRIKKKMYRSEILVYAQRGLAGLCGALDGLAATLSNLLGFPQELSAIVLGGSGTGNHARFTFERRIDENFENNLFYSSAGLQSSTHMKMLTEMEKIIEPELHGAKIEEVTSVAPELPPLTTDPK